MQKQLHCSVRGERGEGRGERGVRLCLCKDDKVSQGVRVANLYETKKKKKRVDLKYNSPLVDSVPWYNDRLYRGGWIQKHLRVQRMQRKEEEMLTG